MAPSRDRIVESRQLVGFLPAPSGGGKGGGGGECVSATRTSKFPKKFARAFKETLSSSSKLLGSESP
jgi:hypothetical protein